MPEFTHIGLGVHKDTIAVALLRHDATECDERVIPNTPEALRKLLARYPDLSLLGTCYEAGPTGDDREHLRMTETLQAGGRAVPERSSTTLCETEKARSSWEAGSGPAEMCGTQSADISMVERRFHVPARLHRNGLGDRLEHADG
jgi:hypothetical protein